MKLSRTWIDQQLNHKQRTLLVDWLMERTSNPTGEVILRALGELFPEFSDELPSVNSALAWKNANWPTELERCRLRRTNEAAAILASAGAGKVDEANRALAQSLLFDQLNAARAAAESGGGGSADVGDLVDAVVSFGHLRAKEIKLEQDERKLAMLERKAAIVDELKKESTERGGLSPETLTHLEHQLKLM